eukprot:SAG31_NODE_9463_length_1273_cov_2.470187_1_plen_153_part_10
MWRCPGARYILVSVGSSIFKIPRNTYFEAGSFYQYCCQAPGPRSPPALSPSRRWARYYRYLLRAPKFRPLPGTVLDPGTVYLVMHPPYLNLGTINLDLEILLLDIVLLGTYIQIWNPPYLYFLSRPVPWSVRLWVRSAICTCGIVNSIPARAV